MQRGSAQKPGSYVKLLVSALQCHLCVCLSQAWEMFPNRGTRPRLTIMRPVARKASKFVIAPVQKGNE